MPALQRTAKAPTPRLLGIALANLAILAAWLWLFHPVYRYLGTIFTRQEFRTNQVILVGVIVLLVLQSRRGHLQFEPARLPRLHPLALGMAVAGAVAFTAAGRWLQINTLNAALFGLATYGLLGLWMEPRRWRAGLPAALLLVGVLPFGDHLETFVGYPLRLATARMVSQGLGSLGFHNLGVDTILIFENGVSQVDSPCSGVKSLWTGAMFLLAATWIDRRPINRRWLLAAVVFVFLLLAANAGRVAVLILVGQAAGWTLLAEMLHVPLGVIGFVAACAVGLGLLRWLDRPHPAAPAAEAGTAQPAAPAGHSYPVVSWLAPALVVLLAALSLLYSPRIQPVSAASIEWRLPARIESQPWPLSEDEIKWITAEGTLPVTAGRWRFRSGGLSGTLLMAASDNWRAQHRPERCFTVYGLEVRDSRLLMAGPDFPLRWLTLGASGGPAGLYSAGYWLQSSRQVTDDYSVRMWDDLSQQPQMWVLVTVLFDQPVDLSSPEAFGLFTDLRQSVQQVLEN